MFSFIIPHKNIPDLLVRCVSSIPKRNDIEIIIVDDNSSDKIVDFDKFPFINDPEINIIFDKSGKGAGHARNLGMDAAKGRWLVFMDADDYCMPCVSKAMDKFCDTDYDMVIFPPISLDSETCALANRTDYALSIINKYNYNPDAYANELRYDLSYVWSKFFKKSVIDEFGIRFEESRVHNDVRFATLASFYSKKIIVSNYTIYCNVARNNNITSTYDISDEIIMERIRIYAERYKFYLNNKIKTPRDVTFILLERYRWFGTHKQYAQAKKILKEAGLSDGEILKGIVSMYAYSAKKIIVNPKKRIRMVYDHFRKVKNV